MRYSRHQWIYLTTRSILAIAVLAALIITSSNQPTQLSLYTGVLFTIIYTCAALTTTRVQVSHRTYVTFALHDAPCLVLLLVGGVYGALIMLASAVVALLIKRSTKWQAYYFNVTNVLFRSVLVLALVELLPIASPWDKRTDALSIVVLITCYTIWDAFNSSLLLAFGPGSKPVWETFTTVLLPTENYTALAATAGVLAAILWDVGLIWVSAFTIVPLVVAQQALIAIGKRFELAEDLERRVEERTIELQSANTALAHVQEAREDEIAGVVHDLRHALQTIERGDGSSSTQRLLHPVHNLVDDLMLASLLRSDALVLRPEPTELPVLLAEICLANLPRYEEQGTALHFQILGDIPTVALDGPRIRRVVQNVLDNALRYTCIYREPGQRAVTVALQASTVVSITIQDNGVGIAAAHLPNLQERFYRIVSGNEQITPDGSGIGLNVCARIMALSDGRLTIASVGEGHGTTVTLQFPINRGACALDRGTIDYDRDRNASADDCRGRHANSNSAPAPALPTR